MEKMQCVLRPSQGETYVTLYLTYHSQKHVVGFHIQSQHKNIQDLTHRKKAYRLKIDFHVLL